VCADRVFNEPVGVRELRQLFDRMYPVLVRYLYTRVWDVDQAEDLAQEAFVRLLKAQPPNPDAWLLAVAGNLAKSAARGDHRRSLRLSLLAEIARDDVVVGADRTFVRDETAERVHRILENLSERDRTLLLLHQDGVSYKDLAQVVGVTPSSIAPLLARARRRFLRLMGTAELHDKKTPIAKKTSAS
jgi:RNA polymerase sigma-70 factor (ECF subfamily)